MNRMLKMAAAVALLVLVVAVGNTEALPRGGGDVCSLVELTALQAAIQGWAQKAVSTSSSVEAAAKTIIGVCDTNDDDNLSPPELVDCIKQGVADPSIPETCYSTLRGGDENGSFGVEELIQLLQMLTGSARKTFSQTLRSGDVIDDCPTEDAIVVQSGIANFLNEYLSMGLTTLQAAQAVIDACDKNADASLSTDEFAGCLKEKLTTDVSDACFRLVTQYVDTNVDGMLEVSEMVSIVEMVAGGT